MRHLRRYRLVLLGAGVALGTACAPADPAGGGAGGRAGSGSGGNTTIGSGGNASGGGPGTGGGPSGTGGSMSGTGGAATGTGGRGGAPATGGATAGTGGRGGTPATGGASATGGSTGAGGAGSGDQFVSGVTITVHPQTTTILNVAWTQAKAAETTWLEFSIPGGAVMTSRPAAATTGMHKDVVLGVPGSTAVTVRIVNKMAGTDYKTKDYMGMTGALPAGMPKPTILAYDAALSTPDRWLFGSVEDSSGGCITDSCYFDGLFWAYIMDRQGRIVWYYVDATNGSATGFQRIARDGEYVWIERSRTGTTGVNKMTLDRTYMETIAIPGLSDAIDVTDDGALLYDSAGQLKERTRAGTTRNIWDCRSVANLSSSCYSNTINWNPADNTVLLSFPGPCTVVQINRQTGAMVASYGDFAGSYTFSPTTWSFEYQHFPNITAAGTLMVSTHLSQYPEGTAPGPMHHAFAEFEIDRPGKRLVEKWSYQDGTEWPISRGMAIRLPNGNTLGNYGTGGAIREITPDKKTVFHVKFDVATGNDYANKMVGHNVFINDLYALNGGGPK